MGEMIKENLITKTTVWAMEIVSQYVKAGDTVIDGTMGNGHDTLALAKLVGPEGKVLAFDVQPMALENTRALLEVEEIAVVAAGSNTGVELILDTNANLRKYAGPSEMAAVLFNLGYLPGGDKTITTTKDETLKALEEALTVVKPGGLVAAVLYSGHVQGAEEKEAILAWAKELSAREYHVAYIAMWNQKKYPPEILLITKK